MKASMRYHLTPVRLASLKKIKTNKYCQGCGELFTLLLGMQNGTAAMRNSLKVSQDIKNRTIIGCSNPTSGIFPKDLKSRAQREISSPMFTTAPFTVAKMWKQP